MDTVLRCSGLFLALAVLLAVPAARADGGENQCFACHSTPSRLIPAVREVLRATAGMPTGSAETAGEG